MDSEASRTDYEVYMSFRGTDIRQGFADVLYEHMDKAGIRVFRDEDELAIGDRIDKIIQAISNSQICVPVFSKTFAQSTWCLDEVRKMVELNKDVVPVFYDVTSDDVRLSTPAYRQFMAEHENAYGKSKVEGWVDALKAIAKFKGPQVLNTSYTTFCKMFVGVLLMKLKPRKRYNLDNLVGIDRQLESAMKLLHIGAGGVRYVVIHGMGGVGKTTIAKVIYDRLSASFDNCGFLEDLRESLGRQSLEYLQKRLGDDLDPKSATAFNLSRDIRQRFQGKKVLIVLDDVDSGEQVEKLVGNSWFAPGSRIIITTRNKDVYNEFANSEENFIQSFEMSMLKQDEALQLFALYAFRKDSPPASYKKLSEEAVSTTGGLPLAIKIIASLLRGKNESVWRNVIARSRKIPHKDVKKRLKISYDSLDQDQQQIFLDIACFFTEMEQSNPSYMWEACDFYPIYGLEVLVSMSLAKITEENILRMHDLLRDLGRDIVREESIGNPMKRSRIWLQEDAVKALMGKGGKEVIQVLSLRSSLVNILTDKHLASLQNIRFLELTGASFEGNSKDLLENLRWLSWHKCPESFNFCLKNLVILDLSQSLIDENWTGWSQVQMASNLKVLDLRNCDNLTCTPDLGEVHTLERLILSGCSKLAVIDSSIGNMRSLKFLDLRDCHSLSSLPEELGLLKDLEEIFVDGNDGTFTLPKSIGDLKSLVSLTLDYLEINSIPDSIGGLIKLKHLSLRWSGIEELPESFGDLESLVELDLSYAGVRELPNSIGRLVKLKELCLHFCGPINELPDSTRCLTSLVRLDLSGTKLSILPDSIGDLLELEVLGLRTCKIRTLPASIERLKKLIELDADSCDLLEEVPPEIGGLSSLRRLLLSCASICMLPSTITQLSLLQELHLQGCDKLQELPELPPGLTNLTVSSSCLKKVHDFSKLDNISSLLITDMNDTEVTQKLAKLKKLELHLSSATTTPFDMSYLTQLESLTLSIQQTDSSPSSLVVSHGSEEIRLPCLCRLKNLLCVDFHNCFMEDGLETLGVRELEDLIVVWVDNCSSKFIEVCLAKNLRSLIITDCKLLRTLPDLSQLKALNALDVNGCGELSQITGLEELESLNSLSVIHCGSVERIGNISKLRNLSDLYVDWCPRLTCIEGIDKLFIRDLTIVNCGQWE